MSRVVRFNGLETSMPSGHAREAGCPDVRLTVASALHNVRGIWESPCDKPPSGTALYE